MATDALIRFSDERRAGRAGALLHPRPDLAVFAVTGSERAKWLNGMVTADVGKLANARGAFGLAVGKTGKILADLWILPTETALLVVLARGLVSAVREHFHRHLIMEDAEASRMLCPTPCSSSTGRFRARSWPSRPRWVRMPPW